MGLLHSKVTKKTVLVIGEQGIGKSSLINLLFSPQNEPESESGTSALSTTKYRDDNILITEIVGIQDLCQENYPDSSTTVPENLMKLMKGIEKDGASLIVYVMRKSCADSISAMNYHYFVNTLCRGQVPVLLVVTHDVNEAPTGDDWVPSQEQHLGAKFKGHVTFSLMPVSSDSAEECSNNLEKEKILNKINELALESPWQPGVLSKETYLESLLGLVASGLPKDTLGTFLESIGDYIDKRSAEWVKKEYEAMKTEAETPDCCDSRNVLIIGETGTGKSSVLNLILGRDQALVSDSATRGTFSIDRYNDYEGYSFLDTIGFNDSAESKSTDGFKNLAKLLKVAHAQGISLVIYVMKKGRINAVSKKNYEYFVKTLCENQVPVLLVVTHCENQRQGQNWYEREKATFDKMGMTFKGVVNGCAMKLNEDIDPEMLEIYKSKRDRTQDEIRKQMENLALKEPWKQKGAWLKYLQRGFQVALTLGFYTGPLYCVFPVLALTLTSVEIVVVTTGLAQFIWAGANILYAKNTNNRLI